VSLGHRHSCLIDKDQRLACWGRNNKQQLAVMGDSTATPNVIDTFGNAAAVSAAGTFTCALGIDGLTRCWGGSEHGQLGLGSFEDTTVPGTLAIPRANLLAVGGFGGCVAHDSGSVSCWGDLDAGNGSSGVNPVPVPSLLANPSVLESGFFHTCAVVGAEILCWGNDDDGQLGRGTRNNVSRYTPVTLPSPATQVDVGDSHACATTQAGLYCWGENEFAQAGNAALQTYYEPVLYDPGITHTAIRMSFGKSCVWAAGGGRCWGRTANGSAATGTSQRHSADPLPILTSNIVNVANGYDHACTLDASGAVRCYGYNGQGQLGSTGPTSTSGVTVAVQPASDIASGARHACALVGATAYCWGHNHRGQLGDGTTAERATPMPVAGPTFVDIGCGDHFCCGRDSASTDIYCWGDNSSGQIGDGSNVNSRTLPTKVILPMATQYVVVGQGGACAKLTNGTFYYWGDNDLGQLGNGTGSDIRTPVLIPELTGSSYLSIGTRGSCAITSGVVSCTGDTRLLANGDRSRSMPMPPVLPVAPACQ
jgi:alpha-tubulin suppressor-like RCC1 family protein